MSSLQTMASGSLQSLLRSASKETTSTGTLPQRAQRAVKSIVASSMSPAALWTPPRTSGASRVGLALILRIRFATYLQARRSSIPLPRSPSIFRLGLDGRCVEPAWPEGEVNHDEARSHRCRHTLLPSYLHHVGFSRREPSPGPPRRLVGEVPGAALCTLRLWGGRILWASNTEVGYRSRRWLSVWHGAGAAVHL